jgi:hypothetical protein
VDGMQAEVPRPRQRVGVELVDMNVLVVQHGAIPLNSG